MRRLINTLLEIPFRKRNLLFLIFFLFASHASAATQVFTTISPAGIAGNLVYTGTPNTHVFFTFIVTDPVNLRFNGAGGG